MQLALALCASRLPDDDALTVHRKVTGQLVSALPQDGWEIRGEALGRYLSALVNEDPVEEGLALALVLEGTSPPARSTAADEPALREFLDGARCWQCAGCGWQLLDPQLELAEAHCLCGKGAGRWGVSVARRPDAGTTAWLLNEAGARAAFEVWSRDYLSRLENGAAAKMNPAGYALAAYLAASGARPRVLVYNAGNASNATRLALSVAVAQEVAMLLDAVDMGGLESVDLSEWSRLRAVGEAWWVENGFKAANMDSWLMDVASAEDLLAPLVAASEVISHRTRLRLEEREDCGRRETQEADGLREANRAFEIAFLHDHQGRDLVAELKRAIAQIREGSARRDGVEDAQATGTRFALGAVEAVLDEITARRPPTPLSPDACRQMADLYNRLAQQGGEEATAS
jgi:hypothetical protein